MIHASNLRPLLLFDAQYFRVSVTQFDELLSRISQRKEKINDPIVFHNCFGNASFSVMLPIANTDTLTFSLWETIAVRGNYWKYELIFFFFA